MLISVCSSFQQSLHVMDMSLSSAAFSFSLVYVSYSPFAYVLSCFKVNVLCLLVMAEQHEQVVRATDCLC